MVKLLNSYMVARRLAVLLIAIVAVVRVAASEFPSPVGLQLESFNGGMHNERSNTLDKVHRLGFKAVELVGDYGLSPDELKAELKSHGLAATSAHFPYTRFRDDPKGVAAECAALGLLLAGCPSMPQRDDLDEQGVLKAAEMFNRAGEAMSAKGLKFFYHPHGYEFKPHGSGTLFDLLMEKTDPKLVYFQMDVYWIVHAGVDPVKLLKRNPDRWVSMHIKDMRKGTATGEFNGHVNRPDFVPLGRGQIDIVSVMRTAHEIGVKSYFIEDESSSPDKGIPQSVQFLRTVAW
jgi:sugar phosphate isomerase/epimerase